MFMFFSKDNQTHRRSVSCLYQMGISLHPHTAFPATSTYYKAVADSQMRTTHSKLPFTYRTFGVSDAQPQSHDSQHADYSEHLLGGDSVRGRRRTTATSFLFSPLSYSGFLFPSPFRLSFLFKPAGVSSSSTETVH